MIPRRALLNFFPKVQFSPGLGYVETDPNAPVGAVGSLGALGDDTLCMMISGLGDNAPAIPTADPSVLNPLDPPPQSPGDGTSVDPFSTLSSWTDKSPLVNWVMNGITAQKNAQQTANQAWTKAKFTLSQEVLRLNDLRRLYNMTCIGTVPDGVDPVARANELADQVTLHSQTVCALAGQVQALSKDYGSADVFSAGYASFPRIQQDMADLCAEAQSYVPMGDDLVEQIAAASSGGGAPVISGFGDQAAAAYSFTAGQATVNPPSSGGQVDAGTNYTAATNPSSGGPQDIHPQSAQVYLPPMAPLDTFTVIPTPQAPPSPPTAPQTPAVPAQPAVCPDGYAPNVYGSCARPTPVPLVDNYAPPPQPLSPQVGPMDTGPSTGLLVVGGVVVLGVLALIALS